MSEDIQKPWYASKTIWANLLLGAGVIIAGTLHFTITAEETASIIVIANLILRAITKNKITIS